MESFDKFLLAVFQVFVVVITVAALIGFSGCVTMLVVNFAAGLFNMTPITFLQAIAVNFVLGLLGTFFRK